MPYLIDGHNLIGQLPTISLADPDDEARLVQLLQRFAMRHRVSITVVFDKGTYGQTALGGAGVSVIFARSPRDADQLLQRKMRALQRPAQWTLVSNDAAVVATAEASGVRVIRASDFVQRLLELDQRPTTPAPDPAQARVQDDELQEWLEVFGVSEDDASKPVDLRRAPKRQQQAPEQAKRQPNSQPPGQQRQQPGATRPRAKGQQRELIKPLPPETPEELDEWMRLFGLDDES